MRKLAIDYGEKRVGFALSDELNILAQPLEVLEIKKNNFEQILFFVKNLLKNYQIDKIILGYPLRSNQNKSERTIKVDDFKLFLESHLDNEIILVNEYGSSISANSILIQSNMSRVKRKKVVDKIAAQKILEDYLTYHK